MADGEMPAHSDESEGLWGDQGAFMGPREGKDVTGPHFPTRSGGLSGTRGAPPGPGSTGEAVTLVPATYSSGAPETTLQPVSITVSCLDSEGAAGGTHAWPLACRPSLCRSRVSGSTAASLGRKGQAGLLAALRWPHYWGRMVPLDPQISNQ